MNPQIRLIAEMQFITAKGDTLALADEATIKNINIVNDAFYYNEGIISLVQETLQLK